MQEEAAHGQQYCMWLTKHQKLFQARLKRLLADGAAPEVQVMPCMRQWDCWPFREY